MATRTHTLTHSPLFARMLASSPATQSQALVCARLQRELLHGVAAQDAFVALFDGFPDFDELAREAAQAPIPRDARMPDSPRRERKPDRRGARGTTAHVSQERTRPASQSPQPRTR